MKTTLPVPVDILKQHTIILGKTGAGKSSAARVLVEFILTPTTDTTLPVNVTILDPKGDWWGLRMKGKRAGFPMVIFGGEHADIPITPHGGAAVADVINKSSFTSLVDISQLTMGERVRFYTDFGTAYYRGGQQKRFLVLDEVHHFCPKGKIPDPQVGKMLHIANTIAAEGRGKGITLIAASQRPQKVHNDFLTSCETLIAMRVLHPADRNAVKDWMDGAGNPQATREIMSGIAALKRGSGWVWSPEVNFGPQVVHFPMFETYDSFAPQSNLIAPPQPQRLDISAIRASMGEAVKILEENDPAHLRARIRELQLSQSNAAPRPVMDQTLILEERYRDLARTSLRDTMGAFMDSFDKAEDEVTELMTAAHSLFEQVRSMQQNLCGLTHRLRAYEPKIPDLPVPTRQEDDKLLQVANQKRNTYVGDAEGREHRTGGQLKILDAMVWLAASRIIEPAREQVSAVANYRGGAYNRAAGELKSLGFITTSEGRMRLTPQGASQGMVRDATMSMVDRWRQSLRSEGQRKIFDALVKHPVSGGWVTKEKLSELTDYRGGAFNRAVGELKTMGAVFYPSAGKVQISENVFG